MSLTQARLKEVLHYDPVTGVWTWLRRDLSGMAKGWNARFAGKNAGQPVNGGYLSIVIDCRRYYAHRLAFLYMDGVMPRGDEEVDHKDTDRTNCRRGNLRLTARAGNQRNKGRQRNNTSGRKGVYFCKGMNKFAANISVGGKCLYLGCFDSVESASSAYALAARQHFGEFARSA
jgi:HNH endonuclease